MNLGGFSNVSFEEINSRIAVDISAVNTFLNYYANQLELDYDDKCQIYRTGNCNADLPNELNRVAFSQGM